MPLPAPVLQKLLEDALPGATVTIIDLAGDNDHYEARIESELFRGKSRIEQHRMVQDALKGQNLHALAVKTVIPE